MKKLTIIIFLLGGISISLAQNLNKYKYFIIPETYEFTGEKDQYQLNSLTKFLLNQEGLNTLMVTQNRPDDLKMDPCLGLNTRLKDNSGLFVTKLVLVFEDCSGNEVFRSREGRSREKEYKEAYHEALRDAFESVKELDYNFVESPPVTAAETPDGAESGTLKPEKQLSNNVEKEKEEPKQKKEPIEQKAVTENAKDSKVGIYSFEGQGYRIRKIDNRFALYPKNGQEPVAMLIPSENDTYIFNSLLLQGVAYFDTNGNLIVEYFDSGQNKKLKREYMLEDQ